MDATRGRGEEGIDKEVEEERKEEQERSEE